MAYVFDVMSAENLPASIRLGTSSWNYPGWKGLVYNESYHNDKDLTARSLIEYSRFPWFRTVGIDSTFYGPPAPRTLSNYATQVPTGFQWVSKVWEEITIPRYAKHKRYGTKAGQSNPKFLDPSVFSEQILTLYQDPKIRACSGPFVFQFQRMGESYFSEFLPKLDGFLRNLPHGFRYAVEVRDGSFLTPQYFSVLNTHGVTHCFNHWTGMPPLKEQMKHAAAAGGLAADFIVARILTPLGIDYQQAVAMFSPYDEIKKPNEQMRADVVLLIRRALSRRADAFILVNNRAEGCAPISVDLIGRMVNRSLKEKPLKDE